MVRFPSRAWPSAWADRSQIGSQSQAGIEEKSSRKSNFAAHPGGFRGPAGAWSAFQAALGRAPGRIALRSDRNPRQELKKSPRGNQISPLTQEVFAALQEHGPLSKPRLAERLGGSLSDRIAIPGRN